MPSQLGDDIRQLSDRLSVRHAESCDPRVAALTRVVEMLLFESDRKRRHDAKANQNVGINWA